MTLAEMFEAENEEFLKFERIDNPKHITPDICAFLMLSEMAPAIGRGSGRPVDIVSAAEHDEIFLATDCQQLATVATIEFVRDLVRCGVRYSEEYDCLCMFV